MTTKQQERDALKKIRKIVADLGEDSYIGTAFKGVFDNADRNIEWDAAFSLADELAIAKEELKAAKLAAENAAELTAKIKQLENALEKEQEWKPYESKHNISQADYLSLANAGGTRMLTDEEAIQLIVDEFAFNPEKITIINTVNKEEVSRHRRCRTVGKIDRTPCYNATDWNYIRFDCGSWHYEIYNGMLNPFYC